MKETQVQSKFTRWVWKNAPDHPLTQESFGYEIKVARKKSLPFSAFRPQQIPFLERTVSHKSFVHKKLSDIDPSIKPYDGFYLHQAKAYVMIYFTTSQLFYVIDVQSFVKHKMQSTRKSITEKSCKLLSKHTITL